MLQSNAQTPQELWAKFGDEKSNEKILLLEKRMAGDSSSFFHPGHPVDALQDDVEEPDAPKEGSRSGSRKRKVSQPQKTSAGTDRAALVVPVVLDVDPLHHLGPGLGSPTQPAPATSHLPNRSHPNDGPAPHQAAAGTAAGTRPRSTPPRTGPNDGPAPHQDTAPGTRQPRTTPTAVAGGSADPHQAPGTAAGGWGAPPSAKKSRNTIDSYFGTAQEAPQGGEQQQQQQRAEGHGEGAAAAAADGLPGSRVVRGACSGCESLSRQLR